MGCMCYECRFSTIVTDNHDELVSVCIHRESDNFLKELDNPFDNCEIGEIDDEDDLVEDF